MGSVNQTNGPDVKSQASEVVDKLEKPPVTPQSKDQTPQEKIDPTLKGGKPNSQRGTIRSHLTFPWQSVASWETGAIEDKKASLKNLKKVQNYIIDHFYSDWYWNTVIIIGTCFFSWLIARFGGGVFSLMFVLLCSSSVYRTEFRRFNANIRDDLTREIASNRLEKDLESMEWLNSFLDKFWRIYMPALSEQVLFQANLVMKDLAPGFGIEKISLDEFTLGSKAPRIDSVKSYTKKGADHVEMDWAFSFTPTDTDGFTKVALKEHISPKVVLGVTIGKAFVSKKLPIIVENMSGIGRMNVKLKLGNTFPHILVVSLQFLEPPTIDYGLKPMGGDTFGIDIMSFVPGLSSIVNGIIHSTMRPMFYAPNSFDIKVADFLPASIGATGYLAVNVRRCFDLKSGPKCAPNSLNPYVELSVSSDPAKKLRTNIKKNINDPVFLESKDLLLNYLEQTLDITVYDFLADKPDDEVIGEVHIPLQSLLQKESQKKVTKLVQQGGKVTGKIELDLDYFPTIPPKILDDGSKEVVTDVESGILKFTLHEARDLDLSKSVIGILHPYAEIYLNNKLVKRGRQLHNSNEPSWDLGFELLINEQSKTRVQVYVKDAANGALVAKLDSNIQDLIFETNRGQQWVSQPSTSRGGYPSKFRITADWKALDLDNSEGFRKVASFQDAPIGGLRIHLRYAQGVKNVEATGYSDPYIRVLVNGNLRLKTPIHNDTLNPIFNHVTFLPIANDHQHILLQMMDDEPEGKDRPLGLCAIHVADFLKRNEDGYFLPYDGREKILEQPVLSDGKNHGTLYYSVSFIPTIPVYTKKQVKHWKEYQKVEQSRIEGEKLKLEEEEKLFKEFPNEYEWIETNEVDVPEPQKQKITFDDAQKYRAGVVVAKVLAGSFTKSDVYIHLLFDDQAQDSGVLQKLFSKKLTSSFGGEAFIRDLPLSSFVVRIGKSLEMTHKNELVVEKVFSTLDVLQKSKLKPITLNIDDRNWIKVELEYFPSGAKLNPFDTVLDEGFVKLEIIGAENLKSVDLNGKSDPLCVLKIDGVEKFKTDKKRKTLDPTWNESTDFTVRSRSRQFFQIQVFDWDYTHDDELIGTGTLDLSGLEPDKSTPLTVQLDTQGKVHLKATYKSVYIRPELSDKVFVPIDLAKAGALPSKALGQAGDVAGNVVGLAGGVVGGVAGGAGNVVGGVGDKAADGLSKIKGFGGFGRLKKNQLSGGEHDDSATTNGDIGTVNTHDGRSSINGNGNGNGNGTGNGFDPNKSFASDVSSAVNDSSLSAPKPGFGGASRFGSIKNGNNGHLRTPSNITDASSFVAGGASSIMTGTGVIPGRLNVIKGEGYEGSNVEVKVLLEVNSKTKDILKTRGSKKDKSNSFHWNELVPFKATSDAKLLFSVKDRHKFGKSQEFGTGSFNLSDHHDSNEDVSIQVGSGTITINVIYLGN